MPRHSQKRHLFGSDLSSPSVHKRQRVHFLHTDYLPVDQWKPSGPPVIDVPYSSEEYSNILSGPCQQDTDSSSADEDAIPRVLHAGSANTPAPAAANELPWWLRPSACSHTSSARDTVSRNANCYYCECRQAHLSTACGRCDRALCDLCVRSCQSCQAVWCPCCSIVDYDAPIERTLCFGCYDDSTRRNEFHGSEKDGDHIMLSWD